MLTGEQLSLAASIGSLIVSAATLALGWAAYQKFLTQKLAETQLTVVLDFVQAIYQSEISLWIESRVGNSISGHRETGNLFELSDGKSKHRETKYDNLPAFSSSAFSIEFKYAAFLKNPLLPSEISKALYAFQKGFMPVVDAIENPGDHVFLGKSKISDGKKIIGIEFKGGYKGFIQHCTALDLSIKSWLRKHGLNDLNQHVINTSPYDFYTKQTYYELDKYDRENLLVAQQRMDEALKAFHDMREQMHKGRENPSE